MEDDISRKKIEENECKEMCEHKKEELAAKKAEEEETKKIQGLMKKQKAELEIKQEKEKKDLIEKEKIECKKQKEELAKKRAEECEKMKQKKEEGDSGEKMEQSEEQIMKNEKEDNVKEVGGTTVGVIRKIGVIVDDSLYTFDSSTDNLVIADVSNSEDGNVKKVHFKANEASTCESELNGDSKIMDSTAETVELSTLKVLCKTLQVRRK